ncbi:MAG: cation:proton antiporter [Nanoarchaeota archaeon]|nr:cation:proton antiporter [Nanoarchaeota archaeon]
MVEVFNQISIIILIVLGVSFIMRILKQPLIIGYIISGIIAGPFFFGILPGVDAIGIFSEFGIAFLLFLVGLHLSPKVIKEVGKISLITGIGQILFTFLFGYFIATLLGFSMITSMYIAIAITFSSTIIILKLLSDKGDLYTLYGKISIGFLLVQDLVAIIILIIVSSVSSGGDVVSQILLTLLKGIVIIFVLAPVSLFILPRFHDFFAKSQEFLFVFSIAWGLGLASLFFYAGLSIEVGALIAGVLLSISPYSLEISSRLKPLRDFFLISFFLLLGAQITIGNISELIVPAVIFSFLILIGNPLIVMSLMGLLGYTKKTNFLAGLTVAQISEFSLILIALGVKVGHISGEILSLMTLIGLITIAGCTYMIMYSEQIYHKLSKHLGLFERKKPTESRLKARQVDAVLFGYNRIGFSILTSLKKIKKNYLVVDYNPDVVANLKKLRIPCLYGDIDDEDLLGELPLDKIEIAVSTIPDFGTNALLIENIRGVNKKAIIIVRAHSIDDALDLYKKGASYVLTPHFLGGEYVARMLSIIKTDEKGYEEEKERHIKMLKEMFSRGSEHPEVEKD